MCGICGIINFDSDYPLNESVIKGMCDEVSFRGPDDEGVYLGWGSEDMGYRIGLGHRRLSIIDLGGGHQPMHNEDKTIWIVFNGEIYNFQDLKKGLEDKGHRFYTNTDTEVIIHLYEERGTECLNELRGMFAFAIWDERRKRLFLARDRVGKKPLCYMEDKGRFIFASEIKSIIKAGNVPRQVDTEALHYYLTFQYVPYPWTMFHGIKKLPPAHYLVWEDGKSTIERYWDLDFSKKLKYSKNEYCEGILSHLKEATKIRLISDVPLGAFLSGGIDSSAVVGMMSQLMSEPVKTFSIGFEEAGYDELPFARIAARHFHTDHHEFVVRSNAIELLPKLIWHYNEPFGDASRLPTYYVANQTRRHVTVALNGDGGDESFAGYERYIATRLGEIFGKMPPVIRHGLSGLAGYLREPMGGKRLEARLKRFLAALPINPKERYASWVTFFNNYTRGLLYSDELKRQTEGIDPLNILFNAYDRANGDPLDRFLYVDIVTYLPNDLLVKMDIATMANSLEARSPFLDHKFMEFSASIPSGLKLKGWTTKYILKEALKGFLPDEILARKKMGFGVPISKWFQNELKDYLKSNLLGAPARGRGYFKIEYIRSIIDEHIKGISDHGPKLWLLLNFELWHRMFIDNKI